MAKIGLKVDGINQYYILLWFFINNKVQGVLDYTAADIGIQKKSHTI